MAGNCLPLPESLPDGSYRVPTNIYFQNARK
jgi:hypothetical protein